MSPSPNNPASKSLSAWQQQFHTVLLQAFPDPGKLEMLVGFGLGENLHVIARPGDLAIMAWDLITWATSHSRLATLLTAARNANPENIDLQALPAPPPTLGVYSQNLKVSNPRRKHSTSVTLESFIINFSECDYKEYLFDPSKPFWPEEDTGAVVYQGGNLVKKYGKSFSSHEEAEEYCSLLERTRNHRSFSKRSSHKMFFERLRSPNPSTPNYPDFYVSISNNTANHIVLRSLEAVVLNVMPLASIGESHSLVSLGRYRMELKPQVGSTTISMIPNIKIESGDAAAFDLVLVPTSSQIGGYSWLMKLRIYYSSRDFVETDNFAIIM